jgi:hypothetical protein
LRSDDLASVTNPFDWNADHIHTNFRSFFRFARKQGFFVEVLGEPWSCFNASNYGALLVVDTEEVRRVWCPLVRIALLCDGTGAGTVGRGATQASN